MSAVEPDSGNAMSEPTDELPMMMVAEPEKAVKLLSHDPAVTLEYVIASGGGDADEFRRCKGVHNLVPSARPDQVVRFLRARNGNVKAAAKMLHNHLAWRAEHIGPGLLNPEEDNELRNELLKNKFCFYGRDLAGRHIVVLRSRLIGKHTYKDIKVAYKALVQLAEYMESILEPLEKITVLVPKTGDTVKNSDFDWYKKVAGMFQHNYPERLAAAHSAPTPSWIRAIWTMFKYVFDPETRNKVFLHNSTEGFKKHVALDQLPEELGGTNPAPLTAEPMTAPVWLYDSEPDTNEDKKSESQRISRSQPAFSL